MCSFLTSLPGHKLAEDRGKRKRKLLPKPGWYDTLVSPGNVRRELAESTRSCKSDLSFLQLQQHPSDLFVNTEFLWTVVLVC